MASAGLLPPLLPLAPKNERRAGVWDQLMSKILAREEGDKVGVVSMLLWWTGSYPKRSLDALRKDEVSLGSL